MITNTTTRKPKAIVQRVGKIVNTEFVDAVRAEYKTQKWLGNSEKLGKPDTLSAWHDLTTLEEFHDLCRKHGADGVRFYFATYPADFTEKPEYAGQLTIVQVATRSRIDKNGNITNKDLYITRNGERTVLGVNMSALCPTHCGQFGDGDLGITIIDKGAKGLEII